MDGFVNQPNGIYFRYFFLFGCTDYYKYGTPLFKYSFLNQEYVTQSNYSHFAEVPRTKCEFELYFVPKIINYKFFRDKYNMVMLRFRTNNNVKVYQPFVHLDHRTPRRNIVTEIHTYFIICIDVRNEHGDKMEKHFSIANDTAVWLGPLSEGQYVCIKISSSNVHTNFGDNLQCLKYNYANSELINSDEYMQKCWEKFNKEKRYAHSYPPTHILVPSPHIRTRVHLPHTYTRVPSPQNHTRVNLPHTYTRVPSSHTHTRVPSQHTHTHVSSPHTYTRVPSPHTYTRVPSPASLYQPTDMQSKSDSHNEGNEETSVLMSENEIENSYIEESDETYSFWNLKSDEKKISIDLYIWILIAIGILLLLIAIILFSIYNNKQQNLVPDEHAEKIQQDNPTIEYHNPLFQTKKNDPFDDDFQ